MKLRNRSLMCLPPFLRPRSPPKPKIKKSATTIAPKSRCATKDVHRGRPRGQKRVFVETDSDTEDVTEEKPVENDNREVSISTADRPPKIPSVLIASSQRYETYNDLLRRRITRSMVNSQGMIKSDTCSIKEKLDRILCRRSMPDRSEISQIRIRSEISQTCIRPSNQFRTPSLAPWSISCPVCFKFFTKDVRENFEDHLRIVHYDYWVKETGLVSISEESDIGKLEEEIDRYVPNGDRKGCVLCSARGIQCSGNLEGL